MEKVNETLFMIAYNNVSDVLETIKENSPFSLSRVWYPSLTDGMQPPRLPLTLPAHPQLPQGGRCTAI